MSNTHIPAIIVEGTAEAAIIDLLLDHHMLIFERKDILKKQVFIGLQPDSFAEEYLVHSFESLIDLHVVLDATNRNFNLKKKWGHLINQTNYYVTREEIEAIQLEADKNWPTLYQKYRANNTGKNQKPSAFFKSSVKNGGLGISNIKKYEYVESLWISQGIPSLRQGILHVQHIMQNKSLLRGTNNRKYLADLLK